MLNTSGLYLIFNVVNHKSYGGSSQCVGRRLDAHRYSLRGNRHPNPHLQAAWNLYGEHCFVFRPLVSVPADTLMQNEQQLIDALVAHPSGTYNIALQPVAPMAGRKHSDTAKARMSAAHTGKGCSDIKRSSCIQSKLPKCRTFSLLSPTGEVVQVTGLKAFCKATGLTPQCVRKVLSGASAHHRGWTRNA